MKSNLFVYFLAFFHISCVNSTPHNFLQNGDLVFTGDSNTTLSKAISEVTQTEKTTNYSHMGIIEKKGKKYYVLHAAPENGSERISLKMFVEKEKQNSKIIDFYRLEGSNKPNLDSVILRAKSMLDKPYNFTYILSDTAYYCSDFVYNSFKSDSIFQMNPMTFKNPGEKEFNQGWIDYYNNLNLEIPEGSLGCNPNGMAASEKLIKIGSL